MLLVVLGKRANMNRRVGNLFELIKYNCYGGQGVISVCEHVERYCLEFLPDKRAKLPKKNSFKQRNYPSGHISYIILSHQNALLKVKMLFPIIFYSNCNKIKIS